MLLHVGKDELLSRRVGESEDKPTDVFRFAVPDVVISSKNFINELCSINPSEVKLFIKNQGKFHDTVGINDCGSYLRWRDSNHGIDNNQLGLGRHSGSDSVVGDGGGADELVTNHGANDYLRGKRRVGHDEYVVCNVLVGESAQTGRPLFILEDERSASLINSWPEVVSTRV